MRESIVERVWPEWWVDVVHGHGAVVGKVGLLQHLEHVVAARLQEGCSHALHVAPVDASVESDQLALTGNFGQPTFFREFLTKAVTVMPNKI